MIWPLKNRNLIEKLINLSDSKRLLRIKALLTTFLLIKRKKIRAKVLTLIKKLHLYQPRIKNLMKILICKSSDLEDLRNNLPPKKNPKLSQPAVPIMLSPIEFWMNLSTKINSMHKKSNSKLISSNTPDLQKFQLIIKQSTLTTEKLLITVTMMNLKSPLITWNLKKNSTPSWMLQQDSKEFPLNLNRLRRTSKKPNKDSLFLPKWIKWDLLWRITTMLTPKLNPWNLIPK